MKTQAAVLVQPKQPLVLAELEIPQLRRGQVLVQVLYSGVCHTQLLEARGYRGKDPYLPHCLGHEGSGVVLETGPEVSKVKPGDRVILSWIKGSGIDVPNTKYDWAGRQVNAGGITTFNRHALLAENRLTVLPEGVDMRLMAYVGCAVATGAGAVLNTAGVRAGQSLVVFGAGGVGLCALAAAATTGCCPLIAVDILPQKLELARQAGASHVVLSDGNNAVEQILRLCPGGADVAIEVTGRPAAMKQALACVRNQGGVAVVVGNAHFGETLEVEPREFNHGKQLRGTWGGDSQPDRDYLRYVRLLSAGKLSVRPLMGALYRLEDINQALADLENGKTARPMLDLSAK